MHKTSSPLSWRLSKERLKLAGSMVNGTIESFTVVYNAPDGFEDKVPYVLALIKLENGEKIVSQIIDSDKIEIGMKVEPCLRKVYVNGDEGIISYGTKFRATK
ncbi:MAG: OB-fold domain-containing protein [Nanoarchaeota archaeon]|nr:OB-fold domain-containing protein [Nanoarchaeota archaeon]